jgi:2,3-bisphosphoglycerate-independent phosphoglycerate mutase
LFEAIHYPINPLPFSLFYATILPRAVPSLKGDPKMKYLLIIGDGMADYPIKGLEGRTPLEVASTPNMDWLSKNGRLGMMRAIPEGMPPGSDVAILSVLGYDPRVYYTGRAPLEAASQGIELREGEVAFRCNLVTIHQYRMVDYSSGHIPTEVARVLIDSLNLQLADEFKRFYPGLSYRHLFIVKGNFDGVECTPPHDIIGRDIDPYLPRGDGGGYLRSIIYSTYDLLKDHPINIKRREDGEMEANMGWLWGQGKNPRLPTISEKFGIDGEVVAEVPLVRGIGLCAGLKALEIRGATGGLDTDYEAMAMAALKAIRSVDFVFLHVEAPDEAGHMGRVDLKMKAIENFDSKVVGRLVDELKMIGPHRILLLTDHPTPIELRTHTDEPVPFCLYDSSKGQGDGVPFDESSARNTSFYIEEGYRLIDLFIRGW